MVYVDETSAQSYSLRAGCLTLHCMRPSHVFANTPECHKLASYQMWFAKNCSINSRKSQKSPIFDKKCSCLVMLSSGSTEILFQPELPGLYILHQEMVIFGIFQKKIVKYPPTTSGSSPKCDVWSISSLFML